MAQESPTLTEAFDEAMIVMEERRVAREAVRASREVMVTTLTGNLINTIRDVKVLLGAEGTCSEEVKATSLVRVGVGHAGELTVYKAVAVIERSAERLQRAVRRLGEQIP